MQNDDRPGVMSPSIAWWILAYLISPGLAFICLRIGRAVSTIECVLGVLAGFTVQIGLVSVLGETNGEPLQIFVTLLLGVSTFTLVTWQYLAGTRVNLWSEKAQKQWRIVGRFFGGLIGLGLALNILVFHLAHKVDRQRNENWKAQNQVTRANHEQR